jgi:GLPGLI family protein
MKKQTSHKNMKKLIIAIMLTTTVFICKAQTVLDTAYLKCYYTYSFLRDTTNTQRIRHDDMILLTGEKISKFYSYRTFQLDSLIATGAQLDISYQVSEYVHHSYANPLYSKFKIGETFEIFKNYPATKTTFIDKILSIYYLYEENSPIQEWKIHQDTTTILGYQCRKATCTFRGRDYVAWFTNEIPINNGPYKFGGLPGLIVKIGDTKSHHMFQLTGTEKVKEPVLFETRDYLKTNRKNYTRIYCRYIKDPMQFLIDDIGTIISSTGSENTPTWKYDVMERDIK